MLGHTTGGVFVLVLFASPVLTAAGASVARAETVEDRVYLAPGLQFGAFSQEISLAVGRAAVTTLDAVPDDLQEDAETDGQ
jgi:hypothetical protein